MLPTGSQITIRPQFSCAEYFEENKELVRCRIGEKNRQSGPDPLSFSMCSQL